MAADWLELLIGGGLGSALTTVLSKVLSRRKDSADSSKAEAEAIQAYQAATRAAQEAIVAADEQVDQARKRSDGLYQMLQALRGEVDAKLAEVRAESQAELISLRRRNEQLTEVIASMEAQLKQRTLDQAEVEWARKRNVEYEAMKAELVQLRAEVEQIPHLRAEVARLTALLEDEQRQARANEALLAQQLTGGDTSNG